MKYFIVNDPYFALIKAKDREEAVKVYTEQVTDDEDGTLREEMYAVPRDYALAMFSRFEDEEKNGLLDPAEVVTRFNKEEADVLGMDSSLS